MARDSRQARRPRLPPFQVPRRGSFVVHDQVRIGAGDAEGRKSLAGYMLRAPFSLEKTTPSPTSPEAAKAALAVLASSEHA